MTLRNCPGLVALIICLALAAPSTGFSQQSAVAAKSPAEASAAGAGASPGSRRTSLRFMTSTDFPPFNYADEDGQLTGFNIDFARAVCVELEVSCDIKAVAFNDILTSLDHGDGDAAVGAIAATPSALGRADFTKRYYFMTAHFAVRKTGDKLDISPVGLEARKISVLAGSSHEAYLRAFFPDSQIISLPTPDAVRDALDKGDVDALFGDGMALAFWTSGSSSKGCCALAGKAFSDDRYFGDGVAIAVRKGDVELSRQIDAAVTHILTSSHYEEMLARYFPVRLF